VLTCYVLTGYVLTGYVRPRVRILMFL
jgi:hypothetical protein